MNVRELKDALSDLPDDMQVICSRDAEGNGYAELSNVDAECVLDEGEIYSASWTADEACMAEESWKEVTEKQRCVVLTPV